MNKNELSYEGIALAYRNGIMLEKGDEEGGMSELTLALLADISQFGFTFDEKLTEAVNTLSVLEIDAFHEFLVQHLQQLVGADVKYEPLFADFPNSIPDMQFVQDTLTKAFVEEKPKSLTLITEEEMYSIFTNLVSAKTSISEGDKEVIAFFVEHEKNNISKYCPEKVFMKENASYLAGLLIEHTDVAEQVLPNYINTATDVLRLATQLSGGDVSLSEPTKFKLNNKNRRLILSLLNSAGLIEEDMLRHENKWIRLGEVLHPGTKKNKCKYANAWVAFNKLRNNPSQIKTFNAKVEQEVLNVKKKGDTKKLVELLSKRPGEFARRLDFVLRNSSDPSTDVGKFTEVIDKITTPMLLTLSAHFKNRNVPAEFRSFIPKGQLAKVQFTEGDSRNTIGEDVIAKLNESMSIELLHRFSELPALEKVYLDPKLKNYPIPFSQRSATKALKTVSRGSKIDLDPSTDFVRMFLYWKQNKEVGRVDVDLSAVAYKEDWSYHSHLSYTCLSGVGGVHSGDITSAPNGASEFIDFNISKAKAAGIRYVAMNVYSYTGQSFANFECFAGVMERQNAAKTGKYDPKTVKNKFDLAGDSRVNIPLILDIETLQFIWADFTLTSRASYGHNLESNKGGVTAMARVADSITKTKPSLYDLFKLHALARGAEIDEEFDSEKEYDEVFSVDRATEIDDIVSNWL